MKCVDSRVNVHILASAKFSTNSQETDNSAVILGSPQLLTPAGKFSRKPEKYFRSYVEKPPADPSYYRYDGGMWLTGISMMQHP